MFQIGKLRPGELYCGHSLKGPLLARVWRRRAVRTRPCRRPLAHLVDVRGWVAGRSLCGGLQRAWLSP